MSASCLYFFSCKAFLGSPFYMRAFLITLFSRIFILPLFSMSSCEHQWLSLYDEFIYSNGISVKFYFDYNWHYKWTRYWMEWESNMENSSIQRVHCQHELNSYTSSDWIQYGMRAIIRKKINTMFKCVFSSCSYLFGFYATEFLFHENKIIWK